MPYVVKCQKMTKNDIFGHFTTYVTMLQSQQNMAIWVSNELSHSVQRANRLEDKNCIVFFHKN